MINARIATFTLAALVWSAGWAAAPAGAPTTAALEAERNASAAPNLDGFWRQTLERLALEPLEASVEPVAEALPFTKYKVTLRSLDGARIRAWLAIPVQGEAPAKPWPVIVSPPGYSGRQAGVLLGECQRGYAVLQVFPRGQGESAELSPIKGDKLTGQLDEPEGAYYRSAYADVIRAIDFVATRKDLDHDRIAMVGGSQGGGIALAVAALDARVKAVVAHVPFLCDMPLAARTQKSLVKTLLDRAKRNDEAALRTLSYFDPVVLAPRVRVPVLLSAGGKDEVCPAGTIKSVYEQLGGRKTLKVYPDLAHTSCLDFYNLMWTWLHENFRGATP
jgi:cephalosporin-C deacetylase